MCRLASVVRSAGGILRLEVELPTVGKLVNRGLLNRLTAGAEPNSRESWPYNPGEAAMLARLYGDGNFIAKSEAGKTLIPAVTRLLPGKREGPALPHGG
jgi:hypothetical protein